MTTSTSEIKVGDYVRSFDFANPRDPEENRDLTGPNASYIEGVVTDIGPQHPDENFEGCDCYRIQVERRIAGGVTVEFPKGLEVMPPVNGTPSWLGGFANGVEKVGITPVTVELGAYSNLQQEPSLANKMAEVLQYVENGAKSWAGTQEEYETWALDVVSGMLTTIAKQLVTKKVESK